MRQLERRHGRPLNLLSLSGGGQNGAFGAGFLTGWRESGRRPEFDAVGGVSTGALLATHALLGTSADDALLEEMYTQINKDDIYNGAPSNTTAPMGGYKQSGNGREMGVFGMEEYLEIKAIIGFD